MEIFETSVSDIIPRTPGVKSFRFKPREDITFKAGQFFFASIKIDGQERTKHFSFSNSPTEKGYIEFTKRITSSEYSQALDRLKIGDWSKIKMPYGAFTFEGEYERVAFLSGGIGITPIRSICKFATDAKLPADIVLLYGNNREEDIIFKSDFDNIQRSNNNFRVIYTLTAPDIDKNKWHGRRGYIDDRMIAEEIADYKERIFYLCGPPIMVSMLQGILKDKLGLDGENIRTENFTGY
jgi:ferredoxin-NADP reductase